MAAFSTRPASSEDYQEVLQVSEGLYDGYDYLPFVFHQWLRDNNRVNVVARLGAKLVGFVSVVSLDDGATCSLDALRIHPNYRCRGFGVRLAKEALNLFDVMAAVVPQHERYIIDSRKSDGLGVLRKVEPTQELSHRWRVYRLCISIGKDALKLDSLDSTSMNSVKACSSNGELLEAVLSDENKQWRTQVFPEGLIMLSQSSKFGEVCNVTTRSNWNAAFEDGPHALIDKEDDESTQESCQLKGISLGLTTQRVKCMTWAAAIYSTNPHSFTAHLGRQLQLAHQHLHGEDFGFLLNCDERFAEVAKSFLLSKVEIEHFDVAFSLSVVERKHQSRQAKLQEVNQTLNRTETTDLK